jgi:ligand-binding sensor domain-containing protein
MKRWFPFCFFLATCITSLAQIPYPSLKLRHFTIADGLSNNEVSCLIQDERGFMWIGTADGLNRFDGDNFVVYKKRWNDSASLSSNIINALIEDSSQRIWIATDEGLCWLDLTTNIIHRYKSHSLENQRILSFALNGNQYLWMGTPEHIHRLDLKNFSLRSFKISFDPAHKVPYANCLILDDSVFFVGTKYGIHKIDTATGTSMLILRTDASIAKIKFCDDTHFWVATWGNGVLRFDKLKNIIDGKMLFPREIENLHQNRIVIDIQPWKDPKGKKYYWAATNYGIALADSALNRFSATYAFETGEISFKIRQCIALFFDHDSNLWITSRMGICKLNFESQKFYNYDLTKFNFLGEIIHIIPDPLNAEQFYLSLWPGGVLKFSTRQQKVLKCWVQPHKPEKDQMPFIFSFIQDKQHHFWAGTDLGGICELDTQKGKYIYFPDPKNSEHWPYNTVLNMREDEHRHLWFASKAGLGMFDLQTHRYHYYRHDDTTVAYSFDDHRMIDLIIDDRDNIWCVAAHEGVFIYDQKNKLFSKVKTYDQENREITDFRGVEIQKDSKGKIWLYGLLGLFEYNEQRNCFQPVINNQIPVFITGFCAEENGNIWLVAGSRLYLFDPEKNEARLFSVLHDLGENDAISTQRLSPNTLCILGSGKFIFFNSGEHEVTKNVDPIRLVDFKLLNNDSSIYVYDNKKLLHFPYNQNNIRFDFRLLNYDDPLSIQYAVMLEGWDDNWNYYGKNNSATYTHLPDGNYTLFVKAANSAGVWSQPYQLAQFSIATPYWRTTWFRLFICLVIFTAVYAIYWYRKRQRKQLENFRTRISSDLHDDVGSTLSTIIMMSAMAEQAGVSSGGNALGWFNRIGNNAREMMEKMRDIVWTINPSKDVVSEIITRMTQYAAQLLEPLNIAFEFSVEEKVYVLKPDFFNKRNIYLIFKEALNNAAKYAECTKIIIHLQAKGTHLEMNITDNGKGFDVNALAEGNGLHNMRQRAAQLKGKLIIESAPLKGTRIILKAPIARMGYFLRKQLC